MKRAMTTARMQHAKKVKGSAPPVPLQMLSVHVPAALQFVLDRCMCGWSKLFQFPARTPRDIFISTCVARGHTDAQTCS